MYYKSNFKLVEKLPNKYLDLIPPFEFTYYTRAIQLGVTISYDGSGYEGFKGCDFNEETGEITITFKDHKLRSGQLKVKRHFKLSDPDYPDCACDEIYEEYLDIHLDKDIDCSCGCHTYEFTNAIGKYYHVIGKEYESITYDELKNLIETDGGGLNAGYKYRITDYVTTVGSNEYQSIGKPFDIIVEAETSKTLSSNAKAVPSDRDTSNYFQYCDLSKWELKYDINNDTKKYAWADPNGKGVIYYMKDDRRNECSYDFKNIKFKVLEEGPYFTFTLKDGSNITDYSVSNTAGCYDNIIKGVTSFDDGCLHLNYIAIIANSSDSSEYNCIENTFGYDCRQILIKQGAARNTFGDECFSIRCNYIGGSTFGNQCKRLYFNEGEDSTFGIFVSGFNFVDSSIKEGTGSFEGIVVENNNNVILTIKSDNIIKNTRFKSGIGSVPSTINIPETGNYVTTVERNKEGNIVVYTDNAGDLRKDLDTHIEIYNNHIEEFNKLVNDNFDKTIESFNEVIEFLKGVTDDETLTGKLNELKSEINDLEASDNEINADISEIYTRLTDITKDLQQGFEEIRNELGSEKNTREQADEEIKSRLSNVETSTSHNFHAIRELEGFVTESNSLLYGMLNQKQDTLVSGNNIKTINGESLLGNGNITIKGGGGSATETTYDNTTSGIEANNVQEAIDTLSTTMITTEPAEGEEVTDYVLMASDVEQSLGDSTKPISQSAVKNAINSIESMIVSVINTPT